MTRFTHKTSNRDVAIKYLKQNDKLRTYGIKISQRKILIFDVLIASFSSLAGDGSPGRRKMGTEDA